MLKNTTKIILILTTLLTFVSSCKKDDDSKQSDYPITISIGEETISWNKSQIFGEEDSSIYSVHIQGNNLNNRINITFSDISFNSNWINEIKNTDFPISGEWFPNFIIFELKESKGNIAIGTYESQSGVIKVSKIKNEKIYLTFSVEMKHQNTNEIITISGEVDGVTYTTQQ